MSPPEDVPDCTDDAIDEPHLSETLAPKKLQYFVNARVEWDLTQYLWTGCTDVNLRDQIMSNASELIRQIIRKQGLHTIYAGHDESAFGDLVQTAWCVAPDTLVFTGNGLERIGDLAKHHYTAFRADGVLVEVGISRARILGKSGLKPAQNFVRFAERDSLKITTKQAYGIEVSLDHPLPVLTSSGVVRKRAIDLQKGDLLGIHVGQNCFGHERRIRFKPKSSQLRGWLPLTTWSDSLCYLMGLVISEGSVSDRIAICNTNPTVVDWLKHNNLGLKFEPNGRGELVCTCTRFTEFVHWVGFKVGVRAPTKQIPTRLLRLPRNLCVAMLQGMFDGDGHANRLTGQVGYTSTSKTLIDQLRVVLANFGIVTKTSRDTRTTARSPGGKISINKYPAWQLLLSSSDSTTFYNQIGFAIPEKQAKKAKLSEQPFILIDRATTAYIQQQITSRPNSFCVSLGLPSRHLLLRKKRFTVATAVKLLEAIPTPFGDARLSELTPKSRCGGRRCGLRAIWLPITSIVASRCPTVDIEVPASGEFFANAILSFNCQIERTLYKYRSRPHCRTCFKPDRPSDSLLYEPTVTEYGILTMADVLKLSSRCPHCNAALLDMPMITADQDRFGGSTTILYKGMSKVFNMWSQIARTVILAYIKKDVRDRKNSDSYVTHLDNRQRQPNDVIVRFLKEARDLCKYNVEHQHIITSLEWLVANDERPHDGIIGKLVERSGLPRQVITAFVRQLKLRSFEFTDSPLNRRVDPKFDRQFKIDYEEE